MILDWIAHQNWSENLTAVATLGTFLLGLRFFWQRPVPTVQAYVRAQDDGGFKLALVLENHANYAVNLVTVEILRPRRADLEWDGARGGIIHANLPITRSYLFARNNTIRQEDHNKSRYEFPVHGLHSKDEEIRLRLTFKGYVQPNWKRHMKINVEIEP